MLHQPDNIMPQLVPFYFVNSMITLLVCLGLVIWVLSVVVLPIFPRLQLTRLFVVNL